MSVVGITRPTTVWPLSALLGIQAMLAIAGGVGLIRDPIENVGMPLSLLEGTPFSDYLIPGLILLLVIGLPPVFAAYGVARRRRWGVWLAGVAGAALLVWISVEVILLGYLPGIGIALQIVMGLLGVVILTLAILRHRYTSLHSGSTLRRLG